MVNLSSSDKEVEVIYVDKDEGLGTGGIVAIILSTILILVAIMCIIFCRCVKKETDDHFKRLKQRAIKEKLREEES